MFVARIDPCCRAARRHVLSELKVVNVELPSKSLTQLIVSWFSNIENGCLLISSNVSMYA